MPSGFDSDKKKQKRLHIEKIKTLQKMCGEALKDFEEISDICHVLQSLRNKLEKDGSDMDHSLLQSKINVVKRVLCEMQEVSKSMGKAGYLIGNFYLRKQSMLETARRKGLTKFFITEIPVTNFPPTNRRNTFLNINNDLTTNYSNINNNKNNNINNSNNILYNPYTPYQHGIMALDDYENDFDEEPPSESPFDKLEKLLNSPAHLSVFFHYLISNSDPSSLCLLFITADLNQLSKHRGIVQYLYSIYCTFLQDNATMKVNIEKEHIDEVRRLIELDKPDKKREQIVKILNSIHQNCMKHVQSLLEDFKYKRLLGLGSLFGDKDLKNIMDPNAGDLVIEKSLWPHFEEFYEDSWDAYSLCLVSCIATYFKMFGFSPQSSSSSKKLDNCPIFRSKIKSSFSQSSFPSQNVRVKTCFIKEHYFTASKYESVQNCHLCGRLVCSAGDYGLNCTDCRKHYHRACINLLNSNCVIKKNKSKDNLKTTVFSPTSAITGSNGPYEIKFFQNKFQVPSVPKDGLSENGTFGSGYGLNSGVQPSSPILSLNTQIDFNRCFSLESSLQPFPDVDLIEEVSLRDTLCLNDTTDRKEFKKKSAIEELVSSETAHVRFLKILHNVHYIPMLHRFPRDFVMLIFPNLQQVITVHNNLKDEFKALTMERNVDYMDRISQILLKRFAGGRGTICKEIFATFIEKQSYAIKELKSRQANDPELDNFIKDKMNHPLCKRLSLQDLLSKVMQRISKYPMLIKNLIKLAQDCKPSILERLKDVQWHVEKITSYVNRIVYEFETKLKQLNLQKRLIIKPIDNPSSNMPNLDIYKSLDLNKHKLLYDGPLKWQVTSDYCISMHVILFEEMIVLLQEQQPQYNQIFEPLTTRSTNQKAAPTNLLLSYHSTLITQNKEDTRTTHSPIIQLSDLIIRPDAKDNKSFFLISTSKHGPQIYSLSTETSQERKTWLQMLTNASQTFKDKKYNASFYYGIDSKRQKGNQKKSVIPKKQTPESGDEDEVPTVRGCEINRMLSMPAGFPEWDAILENMADSDRVVMESAPDLRAVPISNLKKNFEEQDYGFQQQPLPKFSTSSVDNLKEMTDQTSSDALYSMYMEFNKFMEALGTFLAENSSKSKVTTMSSRDLRKWSNELHVKFKDVLNVFKTNEDFVNRSMKRSLSDEDTSG